MTIIWTKTAGDLITMAYQRVQMLGEGQSLSMHRFNVAKDHLNGLLKTLQVQGPNEWRRTTQSINLVDGTASYTLSTRPESVDLVMYKDASAFERELLRWNARDYRVLPNKTARGTPTAYMEDRQKDATVLTVWMIPDASAATGTLEVDYYRVIEDVAATGDALDIPQEWIDGLADVIGARCAVSFNLHNETVDKVEARGAASLALLMNYDREASVTFEYGDEDYG